MPPGLATASSVVETQCVHGSLTDPDTGDVAGALACVQAPSRDTLTQWHGDSDAEVYDWEFGGRR